MRLILDNLHDRATLTATSAAPECEIDNTQRNEREYVWRSTDTTAQVIEASFDRSRYLGAVVLCQHNLSSTARVRLELLDSTGATAWDSGELITAEYIPAGVWRAGIDPWGATYNDQIDQSLTLIDTPLTPCAGYRLTLTDAGNGDGCIEVWRIVAGTWFESTYGPSWGIDLNWRDQGRHQRTAGRTLRTIGGGRPWRELSLVLEHLTPADRTKLIVELAQRGIVADVFIDCYPQRSSIERLSAAFLARPETGFGDSHNRPRNYTSSIKLLEV